MKVKRFLGLGLSIIMMFSSLNVSFGESSVEAEDDVGEKSVVEDIAVSGRSVSAIGVNTLSDNNIVEYSDTIEGGSIYFDTSTGTVTDCDDYVTSAIIPEEINGVSVKIIGEYSFSGADKIEKVSIPGSVEKIERGAFFNGRSNLKNVVLNEGLEAIEENAFYGCKFESIILPNTLKYIESSAFYGTELRSLNIPAGVISLGGSNISGRYYDSGIYLGCENLCELTVDSQNSKYTAVDNVIFSKDFTELVAYAPGKTNTEYTIPGSVKKIKQGSFVKCNNLTAVNIAEGVEIIEGQAFQNSDSNNNINKINIPSSVNNIGAGPFDMDIEYIDVSPNNSKYCSVDGVLYNKECTEIVAYPQKLNSNGSYSILNGTIRIEEHTFDDAELSEIVIPDSINYIGSGAFYGMNNLVNITLPSGIKKIENYTFADCTSLKNLEIPNGVLSIGEAAFEGWGSEQKIMIPRSVTEIDSEVLGWSLYGGYPVLYVYRNSYPATFAIANNIPYVYLDGELPEDNRSIKLNTSEINLYTDGISSSLKATVFDSETEITDVDDLTWESSDENVVTVNKITLTSQCEAVVTPVGVGTATVTAKLSNGSSASCIVNVREEGLTEYELGILENMKKLYGSLYFRYLMTGDNFNHVLYMTENDSSMHLVVDSVGKGIYSGSDGIRDLLSSTTSVEDAEGILIGFLEENDDEITALAEAKSKSKICGILNKSLMNYVQASTLSTDEMKAVNSVLDSEELNAIFDEKGFNGLMDHINDSLKNMGVSDDSDVMNVLKDFSTSDQLQKDLSNGLDVLNTGLKVIDLSKMTIDNLTDYFVLQEADEIYLEILEYIENNAIFDVVKVAAKNVRIRSSQNIEEAANDIYLKLIEESGVEITEKAWEELIDKVWFLKAAKEGKDWGVSLSNQFFHTSESLELKDSMRNLTYIGLALVSYINDNASKYLQSTDNDNEAEYYSERVIYATKMLYKTRVLGEECFENFCKANYIKKWNENVRITESILEMTENELFGDYGTITAFKTLLISCPVDVEIYDASAGKVITVYDGEEAYGEINNVNYKVIYNDDTDDYMKIITIPEGQGYYFKAIGKDLGSVDCIIVSINEETGLIENKGSYNIPVDNNITIESSNIDGENITLIVENAEGTDNLEMEDAFNTNYVELTSIGFDDYVKEMNVGEIEKINFNYSPLNATYPVVYWSSSDENVVKVNSDGVVEAVGEGSAIVTIKSFDDTLAADIAVNVNSYSVDGPTESTTEKTTETTTERVTQATTEKVTQTTTEKMTVTENDTETTTERATVTEGDTETTTRRYVSSGGGGAGASSLTVNGYTATANTEATTEITTDEETTVEEATEETTEAVLSDVRVTIGENSVVINGEGYAVDAAPYIQAQSNSTLVPLRFMALAIAGGSVEDADNSDSVVWDSTTKTASIIYDGKVIEFTAGSNIMTVGGRTQAMDNSVAAEIKEGRMFVPFRALGEALGVDVEWDSDTKTAIYKA